MGLGFGVGRVQIQGCGESAPCPGGFAAGQGENAEQAVGVGGGRGGGQHLPAEGFRSGQGAGVGQAPGFGQQGG